MIIGRVPFSAHLSKNQNFVFVMVGSRPVRCLVDRIQQKGRRHADNISGEGTKVPNSERIVDPLKGRCIQEGMRSTTCRGWIAGLILLLLLLSGLASAAYLSHSVTRRSVGRQSLHRPPSGLAFSSSCGSWPLSAPKNRLAQGTSGGVFLLASASSLPHASSSFEDVPEDTNSTKAKVSSSQPSSSSLSTVPEVTISLVKALVGTGMLALPSGVAAMSDVPQLLWGANAMLLLLGVLSAYTFWLCGRLAHATGGRTLGELWHRVYPNSQGRAISWSNLLYCAGCCLTYSLVLGDSLSGLVRGLLPPAAVATAPAWLLSRQASILAITGAVLWPLCNLSSLSALAPFSALGVLSSAAVTAFVAVRCPALVASSPYAMPHGRYLADLPLPYRPQFNTYHRLRGPAPLVLAAMGCVAWMAHFSAPDFYHALGKAKSSTKTSSSPPPPSTGATDDPNLQQKQQQSQQQLRRFTRMTGMGYAGVAVLNAILLSAGFLTFGGHSQGIVLNNYALADAGATLSRFLVAVSVTCGYPFVFTACRSAAQELFTGSDRTDTATTTSNSNPTGRSASAALLGLITAASLIVRDAGVVVSLNGAVCGAILIYVFPSLLYLRHFPLLSKAEKDEVGSTTRRRGSNVLLRRLERIFCRLLIAFGGVSAVLGAVAAVLVAYFPHLLK